jgi:hypothetical protein
MNGDDEGDPMRKKVGVGMLVLLVSLAAGVTAAQAQGVLTEAELGAALQQAEPAGTIDSIEAASASQGAIEAAFDPGELELPAADRAPKPPASLSLVVMRGHFEDMTAKVPPGTAAPTGSVMTLVMNRGTGNVAALGVGNTAPIMPAGAMIEHPSVTPALRARSASMRRWAVRARQATRARAQVARARAHAATWGNNCKYSPSYDHCYVISRYVMKGAEEAFGGVTEQRTAFINVPGWESGYFVDNEMWSWSKAKGAETWTEVGQQAGEGKGCCNVWWFYAFQNPVEKYKQFVGAPWVWEVPLNVGNHYSMQWAGGDIWCWYYGSSNELKACANYFYKQATVEEAGGEVATESKPSFASAANNGTEWNNYTWHTWNFSEYVTTTAGLCQSLLNGAPGNIYYDTC